MKLQGDEVLDKLNEFADSTLEFGSSLFKRLMKAEAFSTINMSNDMIETDAMLDSFGKGEDDKEPKTTRQSQASRNPDAAFGAGIEGTRLNRSHSVSSGQQSAFQTSGPSAQQ